MGPDTYSFTHSSPYLISVGVECGHAVVQCMRTMLSNLKHTSPVIVQKWVRAYTHLNFDCVSSFPVTLTVSFLKHQSTYSKYLTDLSQIKDTLLKGDSSPSVAGSH